ncbi:MAG: hypothetical protein RBT41_09210 [Clostridia bacterium]|nr:hypothetical protein [Clostridia bacterium]
MMTAVLNKIVDALDFETFFICANEEEAKSMALQLVKELGFEHGSIVFLQQSGPGARVRVRIYAHNPGDQYGWMEKREGEH